MKNKLIILSALFFTTEIHAQHSAKMMTINDFSEIALSPVANRSGQTVLEMKAVSKFDESGINANVNDVQYTLYDNGVAPDAVAGDGIYSCYINQRNNLRARTSALVNNGTVTPTTKGIKIETVPCWKGCKGVIFGGPCRVCLKITITF